MEKELEEKIGNFLRDLLKEDISDVDLITLLNCVEEIGNLTEVEHLIKRRLNWNE
jgi:ferritin